MNGDRRDRRAAGSPFSDATASNMIMRIWPALLLLPLAACDQRDPLENRATAPAPVETVVSTDVAPTARPVRIGEAGPNFAACATRGTVVNTGGEPALPVRASPFADADPVGAGLAEGSRLIVCTQTIDQRWMGVIVPPVDAPENDCGVGVRVSSPRAYDGPCVSGWVNTAFVRSTAR